MKTTHSFPVRRLSTLTRPNISHALKRIADEMPDLKEAAVPDKIVELVTGYYLELHRKPGRLLRRVWKLLGREELP